MMEDVLKSSGSEGLRTEVFLDRALFNSEVVLKACYWLSRDFSCEIVESPPHTIRVIITARHDSTVENLSAIKDVFLVSVADFALREKVDAKTSQVRDLLLAKAFSESGVLEDSPEGVFGDKVEEEKPRSMFTILSNSEF